MVLFSSKWCTYMKILQSNHICDGVIWLVKKDKKYDENKKPNSMVHFHSGGRVVLYKHLRCQNFVLIFCTIVISHNFFIFFKNKCNHMLYVSKAFKTGRISQAISSQQFIPNWIMQKQKNFKRCSDIADLQTLTYDPLFSCV